MPDISTLQFPTASEWTGLVNQYAPDILKWSLVALAASIVLRLIFLFARKKSVLLKMISILSGIAAVVSLGAYWVLNGTVPDVMNELTERASELSPEKLKSIALADIKGPIILAGGAVLAFLIAPFARSRRKKRGADDAAAGDIEIILKTIGWLVCVLGALITFGVI